MVRDYNFRISNNITVTILILIILLLLWQQQQQRRDLSAVYVYLNNRICLKCTNSTQEAAKLQHTNTGPQGYHHSLLLGLKHCPVLLPT